MKFFTHVGALHKSGNILDVVVNRTRKGLHFESFLVQAMCPKNNGTLSGRRLASHMRLELLNHRKSKGARHRQNARDSDAYLHRGVYGACRRERSWVCHNRTGNAGRSGHSICHCRSPDTTTVSQCQEEVLEVA